MFFPRHLWEMSLDLSLSAARFTVTLLALGQSSQLPLRPREWVLARYEPPSDELILPPNTVAATAVQTNIQTAQLSRLLVSAPEPQGTRFANAIRETPSGVGFAEGYYKYLLLTADGTGLAKIIVSEKTRMWCL